MEHKKPETLRKQFNRKVGKINYLKLREMGKGSEENGFVYLISDVKRSSNEKLIRFNRYVYKCSNWGEKWALDDEFITIYGLSIINVRIRVCGIQMRLNRKLEQHNNLIMVLETILRSETRAKGQSDEVICNVIEIHFCIWIESLLRNI
ncbi:CLUMA_CG011604, isoform A [Clunio marinus]|uniref:CLUMA_CG011604, isoform A n=1 Tax=Clunio marinus TaxID=568069 RepID=A0A1J1IEP8_9DIPT|nr:CLUMA_CG011604, isoform A [Clunio marinus]